MRLLRLALSLAMLACLACAGGPLEPAPLDSAHDACRFCRMAVSQPRFAAQLVAPGEEAVFFDDLGCLRAFLAAGQVPAGAVAFVADHRTSEWGRAASAVFTEVPGLDTPMGSHLIAHVDAASRDADPAARGGRPIGAGDLFGAGGLPDGR